MNPKSEVQIISHTVIKPSSPTPPHLQTLNLSLLDQLYPPFFSPQLLFYKNHAHNDTASALSLRLRASLSDTLVDFYPFSGRLRNSACIDCNDEGVFWIEASTNLQLMQVLSQPEASLLNQFLPLSHPETFCLALRCILIIQLTTFSCGGVAVALFPSHKLIDASSLVCFLRNWSARSAERLDDLVPPRFIGDSLMQARELPLMLTDYVTTENCATRRFVFYASKISALMAREAAGSTKVELVLALILRCAIMATKYKSGLNSSAPSLLNQMVDLRRKMSRELSERDVGNLSWMVPVLFEQDEPTIQELVSKMRKEIKIFVDEKANRFKGDEGFSAVCESFAEWAKTLSKAKEAKCFRCTSVCRFPFYEIDFGWGKPVWVTLTSNIRNLVVLLDTKTGDGVEAWVTLDKEEMAIFERHEELLAYAASNPSAAHPRTHRSRI